MVDTHTDRRTLHLTGRVLTGAEKRDLMAFIRVVREDEGQEIALERATAQVDSTVPATATADELHTSALSALDGGDLRTALRLFRRVVALEPRHLLALDNTGRAHLQL